MYSPVLMLYSLMCQDASRYPFPLCFNCWSVWLTITLCLFCRQELMLCWAGQSGEWWAWVPLAFSWQKHLLANTSLLPLAPTAVPWWMSASLPWTQTMSSELEEQETRYENSQSSGFTGRWHLWKKKKRLFKEIICLLAWTYRRDFLHRTQHNFSS